MAQSTATVRTFTGSEAWLDVDVADETPLGSTGERSPVLSGVDLDFQTISGDNSRFDLER